MMTMMTTTMTMMMGASVGCSKLEKSLNNAAEMGDILGRTDGKIGKTVDGIHKQSLLLAVNELTKQVNMEKISPAPTALMPAAKVFAQEATPEEVVEFTHAWLKEIEERAGPLRRGLKKLKKNISLGVPAEHSQSTSTQVIPDALPRKRTSS
jgi:hypothetical protein